MKQLRCNNETADTEEYRRLNTIVDAQKIHMAEFSSAPRSEEISG